MIIHKSDRRARKIADHRDGLNDKEYDNPGPGYETDEKAFPKAGVSAVRPGQFQFAINDSGYRP